MKYNQVADEIINLIQTADSFAASGSQLETALESCSTDDILDHLDYGGVIPERFDHDSTEEKVFAKYCDALLARGLNELGLTARVIEARGDSGDVHASLPDHYSLVGDAKAFRLSRTAKNQKDFKVEALNQWRQGADYACLLAPLYQYPNTKSQIYQQATRYNVTLFSYTHLAFLIRHKPESPALLEALWKSPQSIPESPRADAYWLKIRDVMLELTGQSADDWELVLKDTNARLREQAEEQIRFWEDEKKRILSLDQETAVMELVKAYKIDSKITVIRSTTGV
jgi:type II restriction enzyme